MHSSAIALESTNTIRRPRTAHFGSRHHRLYHRRIRTAPGFHAGSPGPGESSPGARGGGAYVDVWHLPLDSYIHFDSATRATHYEYFLSIYPQPEKKPEADIPGSRPNASSMRTSIVGWPGHYEDILEKRHGEWRILQRKTMINVK